MKFYNKKKLLNKPVLIKITPRGYGKLKYVLETVEKMYAKIYSEKPDSVNACIRREGMLQAYRDVLNLLRGVIND